MKDERRVGRSSVEFDEPSQDHAHVVCPHVALTGICTVCFEAIVDQVLVIAHEVSKRTIVFKVFGEQLRKPQHSPRRSAKE